MPEDPVMLLSYLNLKLRDFYKNLENLCEDLEADQAGIVKKLEAAGYHYDGASNQFVPDS
ncbi:MAG: DUF4250 domain-containing protein [Clostridium sp.]|jgi:hypothetical protein|nr:DUF4250 domain-containing protein [Clostridium sp.]